MSKIIYNLVNKFLMNNPEEEIFKYLNKDNKIIFDIGCYSGAFTKNILKEDRKKNQVSNFYLFDPNPNVSDYLKKLLENKKIKYYEIALDNSNETKQFYLNKFFESSGSSLNSITIDDKKWMISRKIFMQIFQPFKKLKSFEKINVVTQTIDSFCIEKNISNIDILKIDTEGNELNVLKGAKNLLEKNKINIIYVEIIESKLNYDIKKKKVIEFLKKNNFNLKKSYKINSFSFLSGLKGSDNLFVNSKNEN